MDINATFIGQIVVFLIMLGFIAKVVVPMIAKPIHERQTKIAHGLAAAEQGQKDLADAAARGEQIVREARERARSIEEQAHRRANETIAEAKQTAVSEGARIVQAATEEADSQAARMREALQREFGSLVVAGASRLLEREVDPAAHAKLLDELTRDIGRHSANAP
jgi:F-type H+-transporting ATPase subunit b